MAVTLDIEKTSRISQDRNGYRVDRIAYVTGITGNANARLYNAITDASLPAIGDTHPVIPDVTLNSITSEIIDNATVMVRLTYYVDPGSETTAATASLTASGGTVSEETKFDAYGSPLLTYFASVTVQYEQFNTAEVQRARLTLDFTYTSTTYPRAEIEAYSGRVNSLEWNGYAPKTVYCSAVNATKQGEEYQVRFNFVYDPETWQFEQTINGYPLPLTAHTTTPDSELDLTTGKRLWDVFPEIDFTPIGFTIGGTYAVMSGTVISAATTETSIKTTGGKTIILTLTNDTWVTAGTTFDAIRQDILDGLVAGTLPTNINAVGWNALSYAVTSVVRTSNTVVTITLAAQSTYDITRSETVTCVVPASALTTSTHPLAVSQRFKIQA